MLTLFGIGRRKLEPEKPGPSDLGFHIAPDVKASEHPDGLVLIDRRRGTVFSANRAGAMIWSAAAQRWSIEHIAEALSNEFHIPSQTARNDAAEFICRLAEEGLLVRDRN